MAVSRLKVAGIFQDHMVLQRGRNCTVWGTDRPGRKISVSVGGKRASARAGRRGHWRAILPPLKAGGPYELIVHGSSVRKFRDVLAGEVWLASGQSNMAMALAASAGARREVAGADLPDIRFYNVFKREAAHPEADCTGEWWILSPATAGALSAVAYHFARRIHLDLGLPVGVIVNAWSGTQIESWVPAGKSASRGALREALKRWRNLPSRQRMVLDRRRPVRFFLGDVRLDPAGMATRTKRKGKPAMNLGTPFGQWRTSGPSLRIGRDRGGRIRVAGHIAPGESAWAERLLSLSGRTADLRRFRGVQFSARGSDSLAVALEQPSIQDTDRHSSGVFPLGASFARGAVKFKDLAQAGWGVRRPLTLGEIKSLMFVHVPERSGPGLPGGLFNSMVAPLAPFKMRGVLWYQGEGNAGRAREYRELLKALIRGWRRRWGDSQLAFLVVQLPNFRAGGDGAWAALREAQAAAIRETAGSHLAITIDSGDTENLHPPDKRIPAERLALLALGGVYRKSCAYAGPEYAGKKRARGGIRVKFRQAAGGLKAPMGLAGAFQLAGRDRRFHPARARISGNCVLLRSPRVKRPVAVRYAWGDDPKAGLYSAAGLPALPFRTDSWPVPGE